jgi:hypothetical protein
MIGPLHPERIFSRRTKEVPTPLSREGYGPLQGNSVWRSGAFFSASALLLTKAGMHALDKAILVIGLPAIAIFIGIFVFLYRRRQA